MYRRRQKISRKLQDAMQRSRERARMERPAPEYPPELPELRREIIIRDYDFGLVEHKLARRDRGGVPRPGDDVLRARVLEAAQGRGADGLAATTTQNDAEVG